MSQATQQVIVNEYGGVFSIKNVNIASLNEFENAYAKYLKSAGDCKPETNKCSLDIYSQKSNSVISAVQTLYKL